MGDRLHRLLTAGARFADWAAVEHLAAQIDTEQWPSCSDQRARLHQLLQAGRPEVRP